MKDDDLMALAEKLGKEIEAMPKDGKEREISITVGGSNTGNISVGGTQIVVNSTAREPSWSDLDPADLRRQLAHWKAQVWSGHRGYWLNMPCFLILAIGLGLVWGIFTGALPVLSVAGSYPLLPFVVLGVMLPLMLWLMNIRRVEARHIQDCQSVIDDIQAELRRRRR
ncbi:hypothetical protein [Stutzerimonas nitrititolerans]|uniref:hypothetical protein n=1 Tax=Stutzerimonas nitrititolerans TaxID=2482751 RepID=UPI00289B3E1A|nr:hypothetical protein [Stutzerimonas nitrititolerans]